MSWTLQLSHASNGCPSVRGAHHKDHIEHAILGTKDQANNGHRFHGANETNPCDVIQPSTRKVESQDGWTFLPTRELLHFTKGGLCLSHVWRYTTQIVGPGEVLAWSKTMALNSLKMTISFTPILYPRMPTNTVYIEIINKHLDDLSSLTTAKLQQIFFGMRCVCVGDTNPSPLPNPPVPIFFVYQVTAKRPCSISPSSKA